MFRLALLLWRNVLSNPTYVSVDVELLVSVKYFCAEIDNTFISFFLSLLQYPSKVSFAHF